jgi:hypothetical protein
LPEHDSSSILSLNFYPPLIGRKIVILSPSWTVEVDSLIFSTLIPFTMTPWVCSIFLGVEDGEDPAREV